MNKSNFIAQEKMRLMLSEKLFKEVKLTSEEIAAIPKEDLSDDSPLYGVEDEGFCRRDFYDLSDEELARIVSWRQLVRTAGIEKATKTIRGIVVFLLICGIISATLYLILALS